MSHLFACRQCALWTRGFFSCTVSVEPGDGQITVKRNIMFETAKSYGAGALTIITLMSCSWVSAFELGDFGAMNARDRAKLNRLYADQRGSATRRQLPIVVPPPSEILEHRKKLLQSRRQTEPDRANEDNTEGPKAAGSPVLPARPQNRKLPGFPTKSEFLQTLKKDPAKARQLEKKYDVDMSKIPPVRQLPSGARKLPEDSRKRPTNTW